MPQKRSIFLAVLMALVLTAVFTMPFTQSAQAQIQTYPNHEPNDNCITCHEDLYFLHDTGNWYCLREAPMSCSECHGGDPGALTKEQAHAGRAAHPVINEDVSKCQECHPSECNERVDLFKQTAGIDTVLVAAPYTPVSVAEGQVSVPVQNQQGSNPWLNLFELLPIVFVAAAALLAYGIHALRQKR
jgi:hypothetical protein